MTLVDGAQLDLHQSDDPVALLSGSLEAAGGVIRVTTSDPRAETVYFYPDEERISEFRAAERRGFLENHNTPAAEALFTDTVFTLSAADHARARLALVRYFGSRGTWREVISTAVDEWASRITEARHVDLLEQARVLTIAIFTEVVLGIDPASSDGADVGALIRDFVIGAVEAARSSPDSDTMRRATAARDQIFDWTLKSGVGGGSSFAAECFGPEARPAAVRDVAAVLIASVETTANMVAWCLAHWSLADPSQRLDFGVFVRNVEALESPNTVVMRRVVGTMTFQGISLQPGTLLAYSPATPSRSPSSGSTDRLGKVVPLTFGSGSRACPGRPIARHIVECTLRSAAAQPASWTLLTGELPRPVAWFPVRTFGTGTVLTAAR